VVLTVTTRLNRSFNVADALHSNSILVVTVDILVLELANLVKENTKLVGNVGNIFVTSLAPNR
jgi:hypothetical protein